MKIIVAILAGIILGVLGTYLLLSAQQTSPPAPIAQHNSENKPTPTSTRYHHKEEGKLLETLDMLDYDDYYSTEGNTATLSLLDNGRCKIRITIGGETYYLQRIFYLKRGEIEHAAQITYRYPNGGMTNPDAKDAFATEKYSDEVFNPKTSALQAELSYLKQQFSPVHMQQCNS